MTASTYGVATLLAASYHDDDIETLDLISNSMDLGTIVASSFQLSHMLLHTFPGGRIADRAFDIRDEAFDYFAHRLEQHTVKTAAITLADPRDITTAATTIVMGTIVPMLEGDDTPTVNIEQDGLDTRAFIVVIASISEAAVDTFRNYIPLTDMIGDLGNDPSYQQASDKLLSFIPAFTYKLGERGWNDN